MMNHRRRQKTAARPTAATADLEAAGVTREARGEVAAGSGTAGRVTDQRGAPARRAGARWRY